MLYKFCCNIFQKQCSLVSYPHSSRSLSQTHYEVLNLPTHCTEKQIKEAFIKLSKEHHPDVNKDSKSHKKFLQISEAYKILVRTKSRRNYDLGLAGTSSRRENIRTDFTNQQSNYKARNPYADSAFWRNRNRSRDPFYAQKPYYGVDGINRVSNTVIVLLCLTITGVGLALQCLAITKSFTFHREDIINRSMEAQKAHAEIRKSAITNGDVAQLQNLKVQLGVESKGDD